MLNYAVLFSLLQQMILKFLNMSINNDNFSKSKSTKTFKKCSENHNVGKI